MSARIERVFDFALETRDDENEAPTITGHAAVFNDLSDDLGGFQERIKPGAFRKTIGEADVRALFNHDPNYVLGRTTSGTLELREQRKKGLHITARPPDTQTIRDLVLEPMKRGDINQMSFAFTVVKDSWTEPEPDTEDVPVRTLHEVKLYDVSVVTFPAYPTTDAAVRSALEHVGIDYDALAATVARHERGITYTQVDVDLLRGSIDTLSALLPTEEPTEVTPPASEPMPDVVSLELWRQRLTLAEQASH